MNSCLDDLCHFLDDQLLVRALGVAGGLHLLLGSLGESDGEQSQDEAVGGLGLDGSLDQRVPFLDHRAGFISGDVHTIEVGVAIETFNLINLELQLSPGLSLSGVVAVCQ